MDMGNGRVAYRCFHQEFIVEKRFKYVPDDPKEKYPKEFGRGAYGVVCGFIDPSTNEGVAVKKITNVFSKEILAKRALREMKLLQHFRGHPNITCLYDMDIPRPHGFNEVYLYEERMECDLSAIIHSNQPLTDDHFQSFIHQTLAGLKYIHSANVLHRDLKPANLLVTSDCKLKIADFGLARGFSAEPDKKGGFMTEYVATRWYRAPEIMLSLKGYSTAVDVWSVGCIFAELFNRVALLKGRDWVHQLWLIIDAFGMPSEELLNQLDAGPRTYIRDLIPPKPHETNEEYLSRLERGRTQKRQQFATAERFPGPLPKGLSQDWVKPGHDEMGRPFPEGEMGHQYVQRLQKQYEARRSELGKQHEEFAMLKERFEMTWSQMAKAQQEETEARLQANRKELMEFEQDLNTFEAWFNSHLVPNDLALDLMLRMLAFDPDDRISVEEALEHPYVEVWHSPEAEPICPTLFNFDFEEIKTMEERKRYILDEVLKFRDSVRQYPSQAASEAFNQHQVAELDYIPEAHGGQWRADEPRPQEVGPTGGLEQTLANGLDYPGMSL